MRSTPVGPGASLRTGGIPSWNGPLLTSGNGPIPNQTSGNGPLLNQTNGNGPLLTSGNGHLLPGNRRSSTPVVNVQRPPGGARTASPGRGFSMGGQPTVAQGVSPGMVGQSVMGGRPGTNITPGKNISPGPPRPLASGEATTIGQRNFLIESMLGEGAYAQVWSARCGSEKCAIKELQCGQGPGILPDATLKRTLFEVEVIQRLASEEQYKSEMHSPQILEHQLWSLTSSSFVCRIAMTKRPGTSLNKWLEAAARSKPVTSSPDDTVSVYCDSFLQASRVVVVMLRQLVPTFKELNSKIAFHRDVNARNLLCDGGLGQNGGGALADFPLNFSLVDFGSAVSAQSWVGNGEGSWQHDNPTGDARYWGPASWIRFLSGPQGLMSDQTLLRQYTRGLDLYALAICSMEVIGKLHNAEFPSDSVLNGLPRSRASDARMARCIRRMMGSWHDYWVWSCHCFERLAEYSRLVCKQNQSASQTVWKELLSSRIAETVVVRLRELTVDLHSLRELCRSTYGSSGPWAEVSEALAGIRDMTHGVCDWQKLLQRLVPRPAPTGAQSFAPATTMQSAIPSKELTAKKVRSDFIPPAREPTHEVSTQIQSAASSDVTPSTTVVPERTGSPSRTGSKNREKIRVQTPSGPSLPSQLSSSSNAANNHRPQDHIARDPMSHVRGNPQEPLQPLKLHPSPSQKTELWYLLPSENSNNALAENTELTNGSSVSQHPDAGLVSNGGLEEPSADAAPSSTQKAMTPIAADGNLPEDSRNPSGVVQNTPDGEEFDRPDEPRHEALRILRQVESEVRVLKQWYTEAIEAMRAPPFRVPPDTALEIEG